MSYFGFYLACACITFLGYLYKYNVSSRYKGLTFRGKDWIIILVPVLNYFGVLGTVITVIVDLMVKASDFFEDRRWVMEYRVVYKDLNTDHLVDIQCDEETYLRLKRKQKDREEEYNQIICNLWIIIHIQRRIMERDKRN